MAVTRTLDLTLYLGAHSITRNPTFRSRMTEQVVRDFLESGASAMEVRFEKTDYTLQWLYKGFWNTCAKVYYRDQVRVSKREGKLILIRK